MNDRKVDIEADINELKDDGELPSMMEPMLISESSKYRGALTDLAVDLAAHSAGFRHSLPEGVLAALSDLVRAMNCYYSNLIEGHYTHPVDIERALKNDYSENTEKRNLQREARAHITAHKSNLWKIRYSQTDCEAALCTGWKNGLVNKLRSCEVLNHRPVTPLNELFGCCCGAAQGAGSRSLPLTLRASKHRAVTMTRESRLAV